MQTEKDWEGRNEKPEGGTKETGEEERQTEKENKHKGKYRVNRGKRLRRKNHKETEAQNRGAQEATNEEPNTGENT
ncbi:hypothetical protein NC651_034282 [Populus alba x Populus x berolinensis]|nr:hypothetical protein NC651_034282 [Populus alba x Populus x berolinensis]